MSTLKTKVDSKEVFDFLKKNFAADILSLTSIKEGETSRAFSFSSKGGEFVIRVHSKKEGFEKDNYAYEHFGSEGIPIPKMLQMGKLNEQLYCAIAEKAKGKIIDHFTKDEVRAFIPELIKALDAIHDFDISDTGDFGDWDSQGHARKMTWKEYLFQLVDDFSDFEDKESVLKRGVVEIILLGQYESAGISVSNFRERILCYKLHFGLEALKFLSDSGQEENYRWAKERLLALC